MRRIHKDLSWTLLILRDSDVSLASILTVDIPVTYCVTFMLGLAYLIFAPAQSVGLGKGNCHRLCKIVDSNYLYKIHFAMLNSKCEKQG